MFTSNWRDIAFTLCKGFLFFFFFLPPPYSSSFFASFRLAIAAEYLPSAVKLYSKENKREWHIELTPSSAFFPCRLKEKVSHLPLDSEKPSERHGTCTHSPLLSSAFEGMTATSQRVKILKPILGSPAVFFFFFFSQRAAEIRDPTDITELTLFPLCLCLSLLLSSEGSVWPPNTLLLFSI